LLGKQENKQLYQHVCALLNQKTLKRWRVVVNNDDWWRVLEDGEFCHPKDSYCVGI